MPCFMSSAKAGESALPEAAIILPASDTTFSGFIPAKIRVCEIVTLPLGNRSKSVIIMWRHLPMS